MLGSRSRRKTRRHAYAISGIAILMVALVGCAGARAGAPRVMQPGDFKLLAGAWTGSGYIEQSAPMAIQGVIQETGAFYIEQRGSGSSTPGMMRIVDGGVVYESPTSKGKMTFHETSTGWVWKWQGVTTEGKAVTHELTKSK